MIFNKNNNGSAEVKKLLGFMYKSNKFENIETFISIAERDMKRIISKSVLDAADSHYNSEDYLKPDQSDEEKLLLDKLVNKIQLPLIINAYRLYAPSSDIEHGEAGRQISVGTDLKPAFEWMIEKDNTNLIDLYHTSVDMLLEFLDDNIENEPIKALWNGNEIRKASKELFISSASGFNKYFPINYSRRLFMSFLPFLAEKQRNIIKPCFTAEKYTEILAQLKGEQAFSDENKEIVENASLPLAFYTISAALRRLNVELMPDRVVQNYITGTVQAKKTADRSDRIEAAVTLEKEADVELKKFQEYLAKKKAEAAGTVYVSDDITQHIDPTKKYVRL